MPRPARVLVIGKQAGHGATGIPETGSGAVYTMADDVAAIRAALPECDVVFHYGEPRDGLSANWDLATSLRWLNVAGVGIDWALFPALVESDVVLTNSHGVFDTTLPEYLLTLMLGLIKDLPGTVRAQDRREWRHRLQEPLAGSRAVVVGVGSIGRSSGRMLRGLGVDVTLVGRRERDGEPGEGRIRAVADLPDLLPDADWLVLVTPLTPETQGLIGASELARLPARARVVNIGRGPVLVESALIEALETGRLAGAAMDVFEREPLPEDSPLWGMPNVIVSAHIGGDVRGTHEAFARVFLDNLARYQADLPLEHVIDKRLGFTPTD